MITLLFKNNLFSYFLVSVFGVVIWGVTYIETAADVSASINIAHQEYFFSKRAAIVFSFFLTLFGAFFLNYKLKKYLFSYEPTNLFLFFFLLISSFGLHSNNLISYGLVTLLMLFFVNYLFYFIDNENTENQIFNSSFIIGMLIFQNLFFVTFIPLLFLNLGAVKRISLKEVTLIIIGFLLPTIFIVLFTGLTENVEILSSLFKEEYEFPKIPWKFGLYFLSLILFSIGGYRLVVNKRSGIDINIIRLTKNMFVFFIACVIIMVLSFFSFEKEYVAVIFSIPFSIFLSDYFANSTHRFREFIFLFVMSPPILVKFLN